MAQKLGISAHKLLGRTGGELKTRWAEILREDESAEGLRQHLQKHPDIEAFMSSVFSGSPFLASLIVKHPDFTTDCLGGDYQSLFDREMTSLRTQTRDAENEAQIMSVLRIAKQRVSLLVALCDMYHDIDVMICTKLLTHFADEALETALRWCLTTSPLAGSMIVSEEEEPQKKCGYFVLALGKYGAGELNYSSDIDLIIFYDPQKITLKDGVEPGPYMVKLTKLLSRLISDITPDGYVFRTDLRLRPDPSSTSIAMSTHAAFTYYESVGQNWERAAMIKARACAGDIVAGEEFLSELQPFIWRKYLDYAAIADVHSIKRQIDQYKGHGEIAVSGHNIKLGRGGIREIEFFVQTQQLIAGGREHLLRGRETLEMLQALARGEWISPETADELTSCYTFLRRLEHRLQMVDDRQTHHLPKGQEELEKFSHFAGYASLDEMSKKLIHILQTVQRHYEALFENAPSLSDEHGALVFTGGDPDPETIDTLETMGYENPQSVLTIVRSWHHGHARATRTKQAREKLTELTPSLLVSFSKTGEPDRALNAFDQFIKGLPAGIQLFSLLWSNPQLLSLLSMIIGNAPRLSEILSARPRLFDAVLQADFFDLEPSTEGYTQSLKESLSQGQDYQDKLDLARIAAQEEMFRIGVGILTGSVDEEEAGLAYTHLAQSVIISLFEEAKKDLALIYGLIPGSRVAVLAMGKLGGFEMSASSDLDLMLIYDFDPATDQSDGKKSISAGQYFTKLTQKLIAAISALTAEGRIYEVDMRLRPSGNSGPLATQISSFIEYQKNSAWTWEKMALTRARAVAGDDSLQAEISDVIRVNLQEKRDENDVKRDVHEMRQKIWDERGSENMWDIKQASGGLIDVEFIVQYLQLIHGSDIPACLTQNLPKSINAMADAGLLENEEAERLLAAQRLYQKLQHITRICLSGLFDPQDAPEGLKQIILGATTEPDIGTLTARMGEHQGIISELYEKILGARLEGKPGKNVS